MTRRVHISQPHDQYCGRPSPYGNPYSHKENTLAKFKTSSKKESIQKFKEQLDSDLELQKLVWELKGKTLSCFCKEDESCHVDCIIEFLHRDTTLENIFGE